MGGLSSSSQTTNPGGISQGERIQRWALTLAAYDYRIKFKSGQENDNADLLSRLPLPETPVSIPTPGETVLLMDPEALDSSVVTASHIKAWTARDPVLAKVKDMVLQGHIPPNVHDYKPYYRLGFSELSIHDGCLLWGSRVIVPPKRREKMMEQLYINLTLESPVSRCSPSPTFGGPTRMTVWNRRYVLGSCAN